MCWLQPVLVFHFQNVCIVNSDAVKNSPQTSSTTNLIIEERIGDLEQVIGGCERLLGSPIPPTYSRHLSRVLSLWLICLPMSLVASNIPTLVVFFATTAAAYVLVGIDEVGMEIENVFRLLPLQELAGALQNGVKDQFVPYEYKS